MFRVSFSEMVPATIGANGEKIFRKGNRIAAERVHMPASVVVENLRRVRLLDQSNR